MRFVLEINPGDVSNNRRHIPEYDRRRRPTGRLILSSEYREGLRSMSLQVMSQRNKMRARTIAKPAFVRVSIVTYWPTWQGDVDATSKASLDALQHGGVVARAKPQQRVRTQSKAPRPGSLLEEYRPAAS